jgi:hemoglobin
VSDSTLFDRLGGRDAVADVVDAFYDRVLNDDRVLHHFEESDTSALHAHQVQFISAVTGGPVEYTGEEMDDAHSGMDITHEEFDIVAEHLDSALAENQVSDDDRAQVLTAVEALRPKIVEVPRP